jgi:hypothetical protein
VTPAPPPTTDVARLLHTAGFKWDAAGDFWRFDFGGGYQLTLEPLVLDAGEFALGLYNGERLLLHEKPTVDVRPTPREVPA